MAVSNRVFLCGFITFFIEFLLIRIFDVILYPELSYVTIPLAFLGFSLAAWHRTHFKIPKIRTPLTQQCGFALLLFLFRPAMNLFEFSGSPVWQKFLFFGLLFLFCISVFYILGHLLLEIYLDQINEFHKLYFFDLAGGALGIALAIWLPKHIAPGHLIYLLIAFWLAVPICQPTKEPFRLGKILLAGLFVILAIGFPYDTWSFKNKINKHNANAHRENEHKVMQLWDPVSFIEIYKGEENAQTIMFDGGYSRSSIYEFDGDHEKLKNNLFSRIDKEFWNRSVVAPYWLKPASANVLILTGAGGQEIKAALTFSAKNIQVVDIVSSIFDLNRFRFSSYNGNIFNRPEVHLHANEARYFLRTRSNQPYDIIQIFSASTSSSVGNISGGLRTINLLTVEAFDEYFEKLTPNGILHISRGFWPRILLTADASFRKKGLSIYPYVVVFDDPKNPDLLPALFFKKEAWKTAEIQKLQEFFSKNHPFNEFTLAFDPLSFTPASWQNWQKEWLNLDPKRVNMQPASDDKPFFGILLKSLILPSTWAEHVKEKATPFMWRQLNNRSYLNIHSDFMPLFFTFSLCAFLLFLFYFSNKFYFKKHSPLSLFGSYFFFLTGFSYFIIFYCIQYVAQRWVGRPDLSLFLSAVSFFVGTGLGSFMLAPKINKILGLKWILILIGPASYLAYTCLWLNWQFPIDLINQFIVFTVVLLLGFCLGPVFSSSLKILCGQHPPTLAQAWLLNSYGALCSSLISVLTVIFIGFHALMILACCGYALAGICLFLKPKIL